jgi:hypothetical protein
MLTVGIKLAKLNKLYFLAGEEGFRQQRQVNGGERRKNCWSPKGLQETATWMRKPTPLRNRGLNLESLQRLVQDRSRQMHTLSTLENTNHRAKLDLQFASRGNMASPTLEPLRPIRRAVEDCKLSDRGFWLLQPHHECTASITMVHAPSKSLYGKRGLAIQSVLM